MVERGVRFVELTCPSVGADRWDQHGNLKEGHAKHARALVAALVASSGRLANAVNATLLARSSLPVRASQEYRR